jgi:hypothetical protein
MFKVATLAVAAGALMVLCGWSTPAAAQSAEEEVAKQTARLISNAIAERVGDDVEVVYAAPGTQGMVTQSSDMLNTVWGTMTYSRVDFDGGFGGSSGVDIFLGTVGFDHRFDNFIPGISVTGAYANVDQTTGSSAGATVSPYLGYIVNDWFFLNGLVGVSMSNADIGGGDSDSVGVFTEEDANAVWHSGNWLVTGKAGHRFRHSRDHEDGFGSTDSDANTVLAGGKAGYRVDSCAAALCRRPVRVQFQRGRAGRRFRLPDGRFRHAGCAGLLDGPVRPGRGARRRDHELQRHLAGALPVLTRTSSRVGDGDTRHGCVGDGPARVATAASGDQLDQMRRGLPQLSVVVG